jgi:cyclophilin family peptidyl-prolyl cis-trans isomerase
MALCLTRAVSTGSPTWPAGLDLGAEPGKAPPDLASSTRWARLAGWVDPDGPGAYAKTDWEALLAEDKALTEKGAQAHAKAFEVIEEGGHKLQKDDTVVQREVLDPLAWIAEREPLHPYDVLVRCQVLHLLNRFDEALAGLEALALVREGDYAQSALEESARLYESTERFDEAAAAWERLSGMGMASDKPRFQGAAQRARQKKKDLEAERAARAADADDATLPLVLFRTTRGSFVARLHARDVPKSVEHFLKLAASPANSGAGLFYDGTLFQRVIGDGFAQGGDPRTRASGCDADLTGPASATVPVEIDPRHGFWRGALCFARGVQLENASQFFVLTSPRPEFAKNQFTVFGHVIAGQEVVDCLERCDTLLSVRRLAPGTPPAPPEPPPAPPGAAPPAQPAAPR